VATQNQQTKNKKNKEGESMKRKIMFRLAWASLVLALVSAPIISNVSSYASGVPAHQSSGSVIRHSIQSTPMGDPGGSGGGSSAG
jgi:hypothetical protein